MEKKDRKEKEKIKEERNGKSLSSLKQDNKFLWYVKSI